MFFFFFFFLPNNKSRLSEGFCVVRDDKPMERDSGRLQTDNDLSFRAKSDKQNPDNDRKNNITKEEIEHLIRLMCS